MIPRTALLLRFRRIGDIVLTTPALALLRRRFPGIRTTYLVEEPYRRLVDGHPHVDRVLAVPAKQDRKAFLGLLREIRRTRFDALLDFHGGPRAAWIALASGARLKIGHAVRHKSFLYDRTVPRRGTDRPLHSVETHAGLVRAMGAEFETSDIPPLLLPLPRPDETARVEAFLQEADSGSAPLVVLHIGAGNAFRDWGAGPLARLASRFATEGGAKVAVVGAEGDRPRQEEIVRSIPGRRLLPLAGRLNLVELRELIARARLFVGPDSGPMHLAASTGTPLVAVFGPTLPAHFGPWRPGRDPALTVVLEKPFDCRPCRQHECLTADFRCLRAISPDEVYEAGRRFL